MVRQMIAALVATALVGSAQAQTVEQPARFSLENITAFTTQELILPLTAGEPFRVAVTLGGELVTLELSPHSVRSPNFRVVVQDDAGEHALVDVPAPATYRGQVQQNPQRVVAASLVDGQLDAVIDSGLAWQWVIQPLSRFDPRANLAEHIVYRASDINEVGGVCGVPDGPLLVGLDPPGGDPFPDDIRILELAIDTDFEFYLLRGSSNSRVIGDIENIINRVDIIYARDVEVEIVISHIEIRSSSNDPYTTSDPLGLLNQFSNHWASSMRSIPRNLAQLFTGRNLNGPVLGIAWLSSVCSRTTGYSLFQSVGLGTTQRTGVSAHEMGHSFSALHCSGSGCRIMCGGLGGCSGIITSFGAGSIRQIVFFKNRSGCLGFPPPPTIALPFLDTFPTTGWTVGNWADTSGVTLSASGANPPSPPYVAAMNQIATLETNDILVPGILYPTPIFASYWVQHRLVEAGEALTVSYRDRSGVWNTVETIVSDGTNPLGFTPHEFTLDIQAYSNSFRLRLTAAGNDPSDLWMIDNVSVSTRCLADINQDGTLDIFDFLGFQNLFVSNSPLADLTGDGVHDIFDFLAYQNRFVQGCY